MSLDSNSPIDKAAAALLALWEAGETIQSLPVQCQPVSKEQGRQVQMKLCELSGESIAGWKIAATSTGGQKHIGVDGPLEGPYLVNHVHPPNSIISMTGNHMAVAETEFAFRFGQALKSRNSPYGIDEILSAVKSLHPSLELPDSRISDFSKAGAPTLLADCACGKDWIVGTQTSEDWQTMNLAECPTKLIINDEVVTEGFGRDALGGPLEALKWIVNKLSARDITIEAGQYVTTGVCGLPKPIQAGDRVTADLGIFGSVSAVLMT